MKDGHLVIEFRVLDKLHVHKSRIVIKDEFDQLMLNFSLIKQDFII